MTTVKLPVYRRKSRVTGGLEIDRIASGFTFTEGPLWHPDGYLLFSDIPANKMYKLVPGFYPELFLDKSGFSGTDDGDLSDMIGSNGVALDKAGNLVFCQHGNHSIARLNADRSISVLASHYLDKPFNSPNDLVTSSCGAIFFTDPPYGLKDQVLHPSKFQSRAGLYRLYNGEVKLLSTDLRYPNGICFSPGEEFLYAGSNHPDEPFIWRYTLNEEGEIAHRFVLARQNADGIKTDSAGKIYLATDDGVLILSPDGKKLSLLPLPESPANIAWGGRDNKELFVTARTSIYRIRNIR